MERLWIRFSHMLTHLCDIMDDASTESGKTRLSQSQVIDICFSTASQIYQNHYRRIFWILLTMLIISSPEDRHFEKFLSNKKKQRRSYFVRRRLLPLPCQSWFSLTRATRRATAMRRSSPPTLSQRWTSGATSMWSPTPWASSASTQALTSEPLWTGWRR